MSDLTDRVWATSQVLKDFCLAQTSPLPLPINIEVGCESELGVRLQLRNLNQLVAWAARFDQPITFTEKTSFVRVTTCITVCAVAMLPWVHLSHSQAFHLLRNWGYDLSPDEITIPAAHAYSLNISLAPAS